MITLQEQGEEWARTEEEAQQTTQETGFLTVGVIGSGCLQSVPIQKLRVQSGKHTGIGRCRRSSQPTSQGVESGQDLSSAVSFLAQVVVFEESPGV